MVGFITNNWKTILLVYVIGAGAAFVVVNALMWWAGGKEDEEEEWEIYEDAGGKAGLALVALFTGTLAAIIWPGLILIIIGVILYDRMQQKWPELFGNMADTDKEREE